MSIEITKKPDTNTVDVTLKNIIGANTIEHTNTAKYNFLHQSSKDITGEDVIPPGVIYVDNFRRNIIFQVPPEQKELEYHIYPNDVEVPEELDDADELKEAGITEERTFNIWLPWTVYFASFDLSNRINELYMFFANDQSNMFGSRLCINPLPNFFRDHQVCRAYDEAPAASNIAQMINVAYNTVWGSHFNRDTFESFLVACTRRKFLENFGLPKSIAFSMELERFVERRDYDSEIVENCMLDFLEAWSRKSEKFVKEAISWDRANWGDSPMPNISHLVHYIHTSNAVFDETAFTHEVWQKSLQKMT